MEKLCFYNVFPFGCKFIDLLIVKSIYFQKIGSSGLQNATRCGLWWGEMLKARDQYKDAAGVYFRIPGEVMPINLTTVLMGNHHILL